jgi:hypothetical protein
MIFFIPKMWEIYYTIDEQGEVRHKMCRQEKVDIFNILTGNCYHTEAEAKVDVHKQLRRIGKALDCLDKDFINRFSKHLDNV